LEEAILQRQSMERLAAMDREREGAGVPTSDLDEAIRQRQSVESFKAALSRDRERDSNFNYDIKEMPQYNPMMPTPAAQQYERAEFLPNGEPDLPERMPQLYISDPRLKESTSGMAIGRPAAGISSNARHYKMASDIFGTGMDRSWNDGPPPAFAPPEARNVNNGPANVANSVRQFEQPMGAPPPRNRNEPGSFKITEYSSDNGGSSDHDPTADFAIGSPAARKARESSGNPLTGQGYSDQSTKTAKRYYGGSNANQKLW